MKTKAKKAKNAVRSALASHAALEKENQIST